jgi:hypothetical protein
MVPAHLGLGTVAASPGVILLWKALKNVSTLLDLDAFTSFSMEGPLPGGVVVHLATITV